MARHLAAMAILLSCIGYTQAEIINGYTAARNDRFVNGTFPGNTPPPDNPTFFLPTTTYDFSGVGWVPGPNGSGTKQVTMITSDQFICANHFVPGVGATIAFRAKDGTYVTRTVSGQMQISGTDINVGTLSSPVPTGAGGVAAYPISIGPDGSFIGQNMIMFGQHGQVGRNLIGFFDTQTIATNPERLVYSDYDPTNQFDGLPQVQDEFVVTVGDSGSPSFLYFGGRLSLLGHHEVQYPSPAFGSGDSFLADNFAGIALAAPGATVALVPEPSSVLLCGMAGSIGFWLRRRHKAA